MKRIVTMVLTFIISSISLALVGCADKGAPAQAPNGAAKESVVRAYDIPSGVSAYDGAQVHVGETRLPVYSVQVNTSQNWSGSNYTRTANGVCLFELDGIAEITVKPSVQIDYSSVVRPLSAKITPIADIQNNELKLTVKSAGEYVLEINNDKHNAIHFFVSDYDEAGRAKYTDYDNVMVFEAGLHTAANDSRINANNNNCITIPSNTIVYLADGAVVRGRFYAQNATNIGIAGRGIIDGSAFVRDANKNLVTVPMEFNYCKNVQLHDFFVLDPAGWTLSAYYNENVEIDNIKIISSRSNGDGISIQSCKDVNVSGCFVRTWDDGLVVKNYPMWSDRTHYGETENIVFEDCTLWTDLAQSMELGYETVGTKFENVTFDNITVLHALHLAPISIHNANNAEIKNVTYKNITIEDCAVPAANVGIIDFRVLYSSTWSDQHTAPTALGNVAGVTVENVKVISAKKFSAYIGGCHDTRRGFESDHYVSDVTIKNVEVASTRPTKSDCTIRTTGEKYVKNFDFVQDASAAVTGATFVPSQTEEKLAQYGDACKATVVTQP